MHSKFFLEYANRWRRIQWKKPRLDISSRSLKGRYNESYPFFTPSYVRRDMQNDTQTPLFH